MQKPYIGITGFMSRDEVASVLGAVSSSSERLIMVGVLASLKTLGGEKNNWPNRYPAVNEIGEIFTDHPHALNLVHYNTDERDGLGAQLTVLSQIFGGKNMHGVQLNIAWPPNEALAYYKSLCPDKQIVLQIGGRAFGMVDNSPKKLADIVEQYEGLADYILLDPSGGYGKPFDPEVARGYLQALQEKNLDMGLGVAGGLSPGTLDLLDSLVGDFPDLSIDAEGRLRDSEDRLDVDLAKEYVSGAMKVFGLK